MIVSRQRVSILLSCVLLIAATIIAALPAQRTSALTLTTRSLTLQTGTDPGSKPGGVVVHFFTFTISSTANIGSIGFNYCTTAAGTCTLPIGLVTTAATYGVEAGATGFSLVNTTNGTPYITRAASSITAATVVSYHLNNITNPTTTNYPFYIRIATYTSTNITTGVTDTGVVAANTATQIVLTGTMPESLIFCTGATISTTASIPDCTTATSGAISFNQLFSPADTATATSQMAASTNAGTGYNITVNGTTLTSGANTILAMSSVTTGARGISQFGMNLKANTTATSTIAIGAEVTAASNGTTLRGQSLAGYNNVDNFKFVSGDSVANSGNAVLGPTNAQIYTVAYIVNVPGGQPVGTYTTTLTYVCTATF